MFTAAYVCLVLIWFDERGGWRPRALVALLLALAITLTVADRSSWAYLFTYVAACIGLVVPSRLGLQAVIGCAALACVCAHRSTAAGGGWPAATPPAPSASACCWC